MTTDAPAPHYAQAFSVLPGRCFCLIGRGARVRPTGSTTIRGIRGQP